MMKKLNLNLYEYQDAVYLTAGEGNRVFGYTNDDMKRLLGLRLNRELYMVYFIMYNFLLLFYQDSASYQVKEYVRLEDILEQVTTYLASITKDLSVYSMSDVEADSFKSLALLWDELPLVTSDEKDKNRASRASRTGYVKLTFNFLQEQKLFIAVEDRYYPTDRFHAIVENYFEEYKGKSTKYWEERQMPSINRIRVNNVKYNFGTQYYDDFTMRMYGKNTLYDLANGGGKSVLMLLLMQNMIPNCTLDEKQPIEKLFRTGNGNTTIHSLVEWKLDEQDRKEGYRYMTTGFCARKAKDVEGETAKKDVAAIEYFNYCIFYREYNKMILSICRCRRTKSASRFRDCGII